MLTIKLGQRVFNYIDAKQTLDVWYDSTVCPMGSRQYITDNIDKLPAIDDVYNLMVNAGYSGERIIDELLRLYHRFRNFKVDYLENSELTLGFIGYRGTGKSASVAKVVIEDFLLAGKKVWSNMPIKVKVKYRDAEKVFESDEVPKLKLLQGDESLKNGVIVYDEVNMEVAEASRYMAATNLDFTNQIQMIRKKGLDVIWSAQNWNTIDARLRWQSDYIVLCSLNKPENKGIFSYWRVMDATGLSGRLDFDMEMKSHYLLDKVVMQGSAFIRPFWAAYDTHKLQGQGAYNKKELLKQDSGDILDNDYSNIKPFFGLPEISCSQVYEALDITNDRARQTQVGRLFHNEGYRKKRSTFGTYWALVGEND